MVISQVISSFKNAEESSVCISIEGGGERGGLSIARERRAYFGFKFKLSSNRMVNLENWTSSHTKHYIEFYL